MIEIEFPSGMRLSIDSWRLVLSNDTSTEMIDLTNLQAADLIGELVKPWAAAIEMCGGAEESAKCSPGCCDAG